MDNFYMGVDLAAEELALGSGVPRNLPPEGVIVPRVEADGWTRKYLHQMGRNPLCIAEIPPKAGLGGPQVYDEAPAAAPVYAPAPAMIAPREERLTMQPLMAGKPVPVSTPVRVPVPGSGQQTYLGGQVPLKMATGPVPVQAGMGQPISMITQSVHAAPPARMGQALPTVQADLGQAAPPAAAPAPAPAPAPEQPSDPTCGVCPAGPMQMPDGTIVGLDDNITLRTLCQMMPSLLKAMGGACATGDQTALRQGAAPAPYQGGPIPVQNPGMGGYPSFGPGGGMFGGGGFGGGGGGGGGGIQGPIGVVNQATPQGGPGQGGAPGPVGPVGPVGPMGPGSLMDFIFKTDGSFFTVGAPVAIPDFFVEFDVLVAGPVEITVAANFSRPISGSTFPQVTLGIQLEPLGGPITDQELVFIQEQQGAGSDKVFDFPLVGVFPLVLAAGHYTARGLYSGGFGVGLAFVASPTRPAIITVRHS